MVDEEINPPVKLAFYADGRINLTTDPHTASLLGPLALVNCGNSSKDNYAWARFKRDPIGNGGFGTSKRSHRYEFADRYRANQRQCKGVGEVTPSGDFFLVRISANQTRLPAFEDIWPRP